MIPEDIFRAIARQAKSLDILSVVTKATQKKDEPVLARFTLAQMERLERVLEKRNRRAGEYVRIATMIAVDSDIARMDAGLPLPEMGEGSSAAGDAREHVERLVAEAMAAGEPKPKCRAPSRAGAHGSKKKIAH